MMLYQRCCFSLLLLASFVKFNSGIDWSVSGSNSDLRKGYSAGDDACLVKPSVDCFTKGSQTAAKYCKKMGCYWCPKNTTSEPWCVTGETERPRECQIKQSEDCFETGSRVTKKMCDKRNCFWCPNKKGRPWCVKGLSTSNAVDTTESVCKAGFAPRYTSKKSCCSISPAYSCGTLPPKARILGGYVAERDSWPWMIHIVPYGNAVCAAVLINKEYALTVAHCVFRYSAKRMTMTIGLNNVKNPATKWTTWAQLKKNIIHPDFRYSPRLVQDIAVMQFQKPISYSNNIHPICLPHGEDPPVGSKCVVAGWGSTVFRGYASKRLRAAQVFILDPEVCAKAYGPTFNTEKMICAGHMNGKADSCQGDSGGPLMCQRCSSCQWYVAGLVSYGRGCGQPGYPGIYTRVSYFEDWLREKGVIENTKKISC
uniref:transmembrane protease serine 12-like n=1 Tax=Styela clava TaxID=7725 RepID=UPI00193A0FBF|nr:transmembrane protease serine 12-like [Styela clava]